MFRSVFWFFISDELIVKALTSGISALKAESVAHPGGEWDTQELMADPMAPEFNQKKMNVFWVEQMEKSLRVLQPSEEVQESEKKALALMMPILGGLATAEAARLVDEARGNVPGEFIESVVSGLAELPGYFLKVQNYQKRGLRAPTFSPLHSGADERSVGRIIMNIFRDAAADGHQAVREQKECKSKVDGRVADISGWLQQKGITPVV